MAKQTDLDQLEIEVMALRNHANAVLATIAVLKKQEGTLSRSPKKLEKVVREAQVLDRILLRGTRAAAAKRH